MKPCAVIRDSQNRDEYGSIVNYRYDSNAAPFGRDLSSDLDRYNVFLFLNHEFESGTEAYTEFSYYQADTNLIRHPSTTTTGVELWFAAENPYNPFGVCGSPGRLPDWQIPDLSCNGKDLRMDYYRWVEVPRVTDNKAKTLRFLQGFRGSWGDWDWDTALVWSEAERTDITHNRISNNLMDEALTTRPPRPTTLLQAPIRAGPMEATSNGRWWTCTARTRPT